MRLKSLEIKGFKSFADKTQVNFDENITGIVGPNGCGKSNIVDSIRWVIGEQKISHLRSENLESLVFNGSKTRSASGLAEVSLTFENTRNLLPTEFSTVKNACLLSDFKDVKSSIPVVPILNVLNIFRPALHIINVNSEHYVSLTEEFLAERSRLLEMFQSLNPEFYFIGTYDLHETVQQFVLDKKIDMLITIPRNHSFFGSMFKTSNTKKLVYESAIPILAAHE